MFGTSHLRRAPGCEARHDAVLTGYKDAVIHVLRCEVFEAVRFFRASGLQGLRGVVADRGHPYRGAAKQD